MTSLGDATVVGPNYIELKNFIGRPLRDAGFDVATAADEIGCYEVLKLSVLRLIGKLSHNSIFL